VSLLAAATVFAFAFSKEKPMGDVFGFEIKATPKLQVIAASAK
jgi:hypothetical protein